MEAGSNSQTRHIIDPTERSDSCYVYALIGDMSVAGKPPSGSSDTGDAGTEAGSSIQQRIESTEPSVGHIAGAVVAVLLIIAIILVIVS